MKKILLWILSLTVLTAYFARAGEYRVTLKVKDVLLTDCFKRITEQTDVAFVYSDELVANRKVQCDFENYSLDDALKELLTPLKLEFKFPNDHQCIIFKRVLESFFNLEGTIVDEKTGETLPYALVSIEEMNLGDIANSNGHFTIQRILSQKCRVSVQRIGYLKKSVVITLDSSASNITIGLEESALKFNPVIIKEENYELFKISNTVSSFSFSPQDYSLLPVIGDKDISRSLQLMPGIATSNFGASGLNIRGGMPSENLMLFDGIPLYHMNHSFGFFNAFNPDAVKDIQVSKGGYPAKYGGRLSGVIEFTIKNGDFNNPHVSAGVNQMSGNVLTEIPLFGKGSLVLSGRRSFSNNILGSLYKNVFNSFKQNVILYEPAAQRPDNFSSDTKQNYFYDIIGKVTLVPTDHDIVSVSYFSGLDKIETSGKPQKVTTWFTESSNAKNTGYSVRWSRQWHSQFVSTVLYSDSKYMIDNSKFWDNDKPLDTLVINRLDTQNNLEDKSVRLDNQWDIQSLHKFEFGLSYSQFSSAFNFDMQYTPFKTVETKNEFQIDQSHLLTWYVQDTWNISSRSTSTAGIRINKHQHTQSIQYEPRVSFNYIAADHVIVKGAWGKYYQYVMELDDFANLLQGRVSWIQANGEDITQSSADHYILGVKFEDADMLFDAEIFYKKLYNLPETLHEWQITEKFHQSSLTSQNSGNAKGIDLQVRKKVGPFFGWISYSYCKTMTEYYTKGILLISPSSNDSPHKMDIAANYTVGSFTFSATWQYISGRPYSIPKLERNGAGAVIGFAEPDEYNSERFPASHVLNAAVSYSYAADSFRMHGGISVYNIYDRKNIWYRMVNVKNNQIVNADVYMLGITPTLFFEVQL